MVKVMSLKLRRRIWVWRSKPINYMLLNNKEKSKIMKQLNKEAKKVIK